jgi:DNA processing protein
MQEDILKYWLALYRAPGVGTTTFEKILQQVGSPEQAFHTSRSSLEALGLTKKTCDYLNSPGWEKVEQDLEWASQANNYVLTIENEEYPGLLREISGAPPILFIHGQPGILHSLQLAMVGSRNPTPSGKSTAYDFAFHLASAGLTITSGLALGVDAACHKGALAANGQTIAVTGTGLDRVYPAKNRDLAHKIAENGAIVSEFPPGTGPKADHFPRRNRIISGLSLGTLVVEAALQSGSLITARLAVEQGREVFAIPGSIHNPLARGCHRLIQQGAKLVETAEDILNELAPLAQASINSSQPSESNNKNNHKLDRDYQILLEKMGHDPVSIDILVSRCGLTAEEVSSMLLILELQEIVASAPGGTYIRMK